MKADVIVLNGGSSSGKSSLATNLQEQLDGTWLTLGIDDLIRAVSHGPSDRGAGGLMTFASNGTISVEEEFREVLAAWYEGVAAIARAGTRVIVDEVFLDGGVSQDRLKTALQGLDVLWVGVRCRSDVAEEREVRRTGRIRGMARDQAERVHHGVSYDLVVDTSERPSAECARAIVDWASARVS